MLCAPRDLHARSDVLKNALPSLQGIAPRAAIVASTTIVEARRFQERSGVAMTRRRRTLCLLGAVKVGSIAPTGHYRTAAPDVRGIHWPLAQANRLRAALDRYEQQREEDGSPCGTVPESTDKHDVLGWQIVCQPISVAVVLR